MKNTLPIIALAIALFVAGCSATPKLGKDGKPPKGWTLEPQMPVPF